MLGHSIFSFLVLFRRAVTRMLSRCSGECEFISFTGDFLFFLYAGMVSFVSDKGVSSHLLMTYVSWGYSLLVSDVRWFLPRAKGMLLHFFVYL